MGKKILIVDDEKAIVIYDQKTGRVTTISEESEIIKSLSEKIDIMSLYCHPEKRLLKRCSISLNGKGLIWIYVMGS